MPLRKGLVLKGWDGAIGLGSVRVPVCDFRRPAGKPVFGETPNTTRGDAYAPQTPQRCPLLVKDAEILYENRSRDR